MYKQKDFPKLVSKSASTQSNYGMLTNAGLKRWIVVVADQLGGLSPAL